MAINVQEGQRQRPLTLPIFHSAPQSHEIIFIPPLGIALPPIPLHPRPQLLPCPFLLLFLSSPLLRNPVLLFRMRVSDLPLLDPLLLEVGFLGSREVGSGGYSARFLEAVDDCVGAGWDKGFFDLFKRKMG